MTAISQYYSQCYFPGLAEERESLREKILRFWESIRDLFPFKPPVHYVIDFAMAETLREEEKQTGVRGGESERVSGGESGGEGEGGVDLDVVVLELNPFNFSTSGCLFDWECEGDNDILEGKRPFEFRIRSAPIAHSLRNKVPASWVPLIFSD